MRLKAEWLHPATCARAATSSTLATALQAECREAGPHSLSAMPTSDAYNIPSSAGGCTHFWRHPEPAPLKTHESPPTQSAHNAIYTADPAYNGRTVHARTGTPLPRACKACIAPYSLRYSLSWPSQGSLPYCSLRYLVLLYSTGIVDVVLALGAMKS